MTREYTVITRVHSNSNWLMTGEYETKEGTIESWSYHSDGNPRTQTDDTIIANLAYAGNDVDWHTHEVIALVETCEDNVTTDFDRSYPKRKPEPESDLCPACIQTATESGVTPATKAHCSGCVAAMETYIAELEAANLGLEDK